MKTLNKLQIKPQRLIKNEDLKKLRGGYDTWVCWSEGYMEQGCMGYPICNVIAEDIDAALRDCNLMGGSCVEG